MTSSMSFPAAALPAIADAAGRQGWFQLSGCAAARSFVLQNGVHAPDARLLLAGLFAGLAAVQALRGDVMAPATSMLWYAMTLVSPSDSP